MSLTPLELVGALRQDQLQQACDLGLTDCLLCGSCAYVCPAAIPLTEFFDWGKQSLQRRRLQEQKSERTRQQGEARRERLQREAAEKEAAKAAKAAAAPRRPRRQTTEEEAS
jgi:electron transport complex protein RnfC